MNIKSLATEELIAARDKLKNEISSLSGKQMAYKILANSLYGAISNAGFRYFDLRIAEAITLTGQASDQHVELVLNYYMNRILKTDKIDYVTYGDTDSIYLNVDSLVKSATKSSATVADVVQFLDKVGSTKIQEQINVSIDRIYEIGSCFNKVMDMKREAIASRAIWTGKKRYAMIVHNSEGVDYHPYKLKVMGMDIVKSSTPKFIRAKLKDALTVIFEKDQQSLYDYVSSVKDEFWKAAPEDISFPRSITDLQKYTDSRTIFTKGTPIHVRGSLLYNTINSKNQDRTTIKDGDKIKFIYLKMPNPIHENVIAFPSSESLPKDMGLHSYIDYELQWEKCFLSPLNGICNAIGWKSEKIATLEDFFS